MNDLKKIELINMYELRNAKHQFKNDKKALKRSTKHILNRYEQLRDIYISQNDISINFINIQICWVKNPSWGSNPHAKVDIYYSNNTCECLTGRASGCGYDKESAAVAQALNKSIIIKYLLIQNLKMYQLSSLKEAAKNHKLGYGSGYGILPYFEGGVGQSCLNDILLKLLGLNSRVDSCTAYFRKKSKMLICSYGKNETFYILKRL